jgi:hypothetical protein
VDIHHQDRPGITLRYLDGSEEYAAPGQPRIRTRWREPSSDSPTFYQIPLAAQLPLGPHENLIVAGRMIDADPQAHGAIRVMVNLNQTGEAAGVACALALRKGCPVGAVDAPLLRATLCEGGSLVGVRTGPSTTAA